MESDLRVVVLLINGGCGTSHPYASMVNQIREWMSKSWEVRCVLIWREAYQMADCLANLAHDLGLGTHVWESPPSRCSNLLVCDVAGVLFSRATHL